MKKIVGLTYSIDELRSLLGVADKYEDWRNFKRIVLDKIKKEINKHTSIKMTFTTERDGRKVVGVIFNFQIKKKRTNFQSFCHSTFLICIKSRRTEVERSYLLVNYYLLMVSKKVSFWK